VLRIPIFFAQAAAPLPFNLRVEGRLIAMLDNIRELDLDLLNRATHAKV
jgi:hypothetical protein